MPSPPPPSDGPLPGGAPPTGVIGLGEIGRGVAGCLAGAGVALTVHDVRPEATAPFGATARVAGSPATLARHCTVVVVAVVDDKQVTTVLDGPEGLLRAEGWTGVAVVVSTVGIATVRELAARAGRHGASLVDCGVSGGPGAAAEGQLVCMVGGEPEDVDRVRPVLDVVGSLVLHMGPLGSGLAAKLARNLVQYGSWLAAYEAQRVAEAAGVPLPLLAQAVRESDRRIGGAATLMFRETVAPLRADVPTDAGLIAPMQAAARLAAKDLGALLDLAASLGVETPLAGLAAASTGAIFGVAPAGGDPVREAGG